jgi:hypothetical protein
MKNLEDREIVLQSDLSLARARQEGVMLSAAMHLVAQRASPFAEFTLSVTNVLRVTIGEPYRLLI